MTTVSHDVRPANIARRLNAAMAEMIALRGVPSEARFDVELNALIAHYPTGPIMVKPIPLGRPTV